MQVVLEIDLLGLCYYKVMLLCIFIFAQMKIFICNVEFLFYYLNSLSFLVAYGVQNKF